MAIKRALDQTFSVQTAGEIKLLQLLRQNLKMASKGASKSIAKRVKDAAVAGYEAAKNFLSPLKGQDPHYPFKMLLIGETGSGKTSFLNLLYNCGMVQALGCGFGKDGLEQFRRFNNIKLENAQALSMESKTNDATLYNVHLGELKVGVIDTPGFGDSRGLKQDEINAKRIIDVLKKEDYINCVCLIINGRQPRASASLKYVLTEITAILPREILSNVIVVFSNTSDPLDLTFDPNTLITYFGSPVPQRHIFFVENPYCRFEKAKLKVEQLGIERVAESLQKSFEDTAKVLSDMFVTVKDFQQVHTHHFITLYEKKQAIEGNVLRMVTEYDNQIKLEKAIKEAKEEVDAAVNSKSLNKEFRTTQRFKKTVVDKTNYHNTLCGYKDCHSNCHEHCGLSKSFDKEVFKYCACMRGANNTCSVCGHDYTYHYHDEALFTEVEVVKDLIDGEMQKKFEQAKNDEDRAQMLYKELEDQKQASKDTRRRLSRELLQKIKEFEELGVARNYAKLIENQLAVIETRLKGTTGSESSYLRETQEELRKKLKLVQGAKLGQLD